STRPDVNDFDWVENEYTIVRYPRFRVAYNTDAGLFMTAGILRRTYGFRKSPYYSLNQLRFGYAFYRAFKINYLGEFNQVYRGYDLIVQADLVDPVINNVF